MCDSFRLQFQFVNSFLSLFYIAFYLQDQARLKEVGDLISRPRAVPSSTKPVACTLFQQLAALLISRQVIGNLKESAWPYLLEHMRLAKMSFDLWGVLTPVAARPPPGVAAPPPDADAKADADGQPESGTAGARRSIGQAELESSLFKVRLRTQFARCTPLPSHKRGYELAGATRLNRDLHYRHPFLTDKPLFSGK